LIFVIICVVYVIYGVY